MKSMKRHRLTLRDNTQGITKGSLRRLARRGGVKRLSGLVYEDMRSVLKKFLEKIIRDTVTYTEHAGRKTVMPVDIILSLKRNGRTIYGFGDCVPPQRNVSSQRIVSSTKGKDAVVTEEKDAA